MIKNIKQIEDFIKNNLDELTWVHTQAIRSIAQRLVKLENADKDIVEIAVLFHDIARTKASPLEHAREGAKITKEFLKKLNFDGEFIKKVVHCIETHSSPWAKNAPMPSTIEAKIVFDADMIQQLGAFGIIKHILKYKDKNFSELIEAAEKDLINIAFKLLITKSGKKLGKEKIDYVKKFFESAILKPEMIYLE